MKKKTSLCTPKPCKTCADRMTCRSQCEKVRDEQAYESQVGWWRLKDSYQDVDEIASTSENLLEDLSPELLNEISNLSHVEHSVFVLLHYKIPQDQVCSVLKITKKTLQNHVSEIRSKYPVLCDLF